jgi:hypothetical protein
VLLAFANQGVSSDPVQRDTARLLVALDWIDENFRVNTAKVRAKVALFDAALKNSDKAAIKAAILQLRTAAETLYSAFERQVNASTHDPQAARVWAALVHVAQTLHISEPSGVKNAVMKQTWYSPENIEKRVQEFVQLVAKGDKSEAAFALRSVGILCSNARSVEQWINGPAKAALDKMMKSAYARFVRTKVCR